MPEWTIANNGLIQCNQAEKKGVPGQAMKGLIYPCLKIFLQILVFKKSWNIWCSTNLRILQSVHRLTWGCSLARVYTWLTPIPAPEPKLFQAPGLWFAPPPIKNVNSPVGKCPVSDHTTTHSHEAADPRAWLITVLPVHFQSLSSVQIHPPQTLQTKPISSSTKCTMTK